MQISGVLTMLPDRCGHVLKQIMTDTHTDKYLVARNLAAARGHIISANLLLPTDGNNDNSDENTIVALIIM